MVHRVHPSSRAQNGGSHALCGAAAADIVRHGVVDIGGSRVWVLLEKRHSGHDLAGLAVSTLRHLFFNPGLLDRVAAVVRQPFYSRHFLAGRGRNRVDAGTGGFAVYMYSTSTTGGDTAAVFGAG